MRYDLSDPEDLKALIKKLKDDEVYASVLHSSIGGSSSIWKKKDLNARYPGGPTPWQAGRSGNPTLMRVRTKKDLKRLLYYVEKGKKPPGPGHYDLNDIDHLKELIEKIGDSVYATYLNFGISYSIIEDKNFNRKVDSGLVSAYTKDDLIKRLKNLKDKEKQKKKDTP